PTASPDTLPLPDALPISRRRSSERTRAGPTRRAFMISPPRIAGPSDPLALCDLDVHDRGCDGLDDGRKPLGQLGRHSGGRAVLQDRKSTRLNSSHELASY